MKRLLAILGSLSLTAVATSTVISCKKNNEKSNEFRNYVNQTKGTYDQESNPLTKSSMGLIYVGAKDNASSKSFEYALERVFGSINEASTKLSKEDTVETFNLKSQMANFVVQTNEISGNKEIFFTTDDKNKFNNIELMKLKIDGNGTKLTLDAKIESRENGIILSNWWNDDDIQNLWNKLEQNTTTITEAIGYKITNQNNNESDFVNAWTTTFKTWLENKNADRAIKDVKIELDSKKSNYGKVSAEFNSPTYGILTESNQGFQSLAYDYSKIQFHFDSIIVDKVQDYWNSDLFKTITNDILKPDLLYQWAANKPDELKVKDNGKDSEEQIERIRKGRIKEIDKIIKGINAKGPLFFLVKNGHIMKIMRGWNTYAKFQKDNNKVTPDENYNDDLNNWINELSKIIQSSFKENTNELTNFTIDKWNFAITDDEGKSNWDSNK